MHSIVKWLKRNISDKDVQSLIVDWDICIYHCNNPLLPEAGRSNVVVYCLYVYMVSYDQLKYHFNGTKITFFYHFIYMYGDNLIDVLQVFCCNNSL